MSGAIGESTRTQVCKTCHEAKPIEQFAYHTRSHTGRYYICDTCRAAAHRVPTHATVERQAEAVIAETRAARAAQSSGKWQKPPAVARGEITVIPGVGVLYPPSHEEAAPVAPSVPVTPAPIEAPVLEAAQPSRMPIMDRLHVPLISAVPDEARVALEEWITSAEVGPSEAFVIADYIVLRQDGRYTLLTLDGSAPRASIEPETLLYIIGLRAHTADYAALRGVRYH